MNKYLNISFDIPESIDELLTKWDNDIQSQKIFNDIIDKIDGYDNETNNLREIIFRKIFMITNNHDLSAYVCEDIGLIYFCESHNIKNDWLNKRRETYLSGKIPYV